ncbi:MAG: ABC transporter substrate-binding protein [Clostridia bacterium]|nr:ABC transporter substrate-binding protein [Clostridia bacterium]
MKKFISIILVALISVFALASCADTTNAASDTYKVGVVQYISHPSLDNCFAGVEAALTERYGEKVEITRQIGSDSSADSDCATYASQFAAQNYDMIVAIATPAATSAFAAAEAKDIPVVFCAVSDPVAVGLVESLDAPGYNCSGTSDVLDMEAQLDLITSLQPDVKKIGVLYTSSEANSIAQLALLEEAAKAYGVEIVPQSIQSDSDIPSAATALCAKVDCLNNFTDNKVVNNLSVVLDAANEAGIPVYGSEEEQVKNGCLASVSIDYVALGKVTGNMAADALEGADLATMAVKTISDATPVVNTDVLAAFNITMPAAYANATTVTTNK